MATQSFTFPTGTETYIKSLVNGQTVLSLSDADQVTVGDYPITSGIFPYNHSLEIHRSYYCAVQPDGTVTLFIVTADTTTLALAEQAYSDASAMGGTPPVPPLPTGSLFTDLTDTPASYGGQAGKVATVNATESGLGFEDATGGISGADVDTKISTHDTATDAHQDIRDLIPAAGTDDQTATEVPVTAAGFTGNLSSSDDDVQAALDTIDGLTLGGDDQDASGVDTDTANFNNNLSSADTTVQAALETLDDLTAGGGGSGSDPVLIIDGMAFESWDTDIAVADWRDYELLEVLLLDSSSTAHSYQFLVGVDALDAANKGQISVEQNAEIEIIATAGSDSLNFNIGAGGVSSFPSTGDTISIWGLSAGGGGGGGGGGGTGDITAVSTGSNSGLAGGADSGDADLTLDLSNLAGQASLAGGDRLAFDDISDDVTKHITTQNLAAHFAPTAGGLAPTTTGRIHVRIHGLPALTTLEGSDELVVTDDSATDNVSKKITIAHFADHLAGSGITAASDGSLSADGGGGGGGTDDQTAAEVTVDTTNFSQNLTSTDDSVQDALETIDQFSQYQGTWQQASWPAGVIVTRSGIAYISLVNNNTQIPTPSSTQWSGLPEGYTYRGEAPVAATNYNYGQVVHDPDTSIYYFYHSTISASVARADIATHADFEAIVGTGVSDGSCIWRRFDRRPVTIANQAIGHLKIGSSVGGTNQAVGRIIEADGSGRVRWADKGGGSGGGGGDALISADFPTPDATNVYDVIDHFGQLYANIPEAIAQVVTWDASVDGDDVSSLWGESNGTYIFRGIEYTSDVTSPQSGNVVLLPTGAFRHRGATRWSHLGTPQGWVGGPYVDEDDANDHVTATNDVSAYDNSLQLVTAFTAGTTHYQWFNVVSETPQLTDAEVVDGTSDFAGTISGSQLDDFAPELGIAEATSKVSDEFGRASGRRIGEAIDAHVVRSTNATTDVAETSAIGTSLELSRDDHVHRLATDDTLHRDGAGQLGVNINDIIEQVSETVQYFTDSTGNFDDSNHATMGEEYTTSRWQKAIHKVEIHIGHQAGDGILQYRAGVYEVEADGEIITVFGRSAIRDVGNSGRWIFNFHPPVRVDPSSRIIIVATREDEGNSTTARVLEGSESGDSPNISYMDAGEDFDRVHRVTYTEDYPVVGTTRHSHDAAFVRGNIKIWYTNTYHEGLLVGEDSINAAHINSESAADGEVLTADGSGGAAWEASSGGGGGGSATELTQAMVEDDADTTFGLVSGERLSQAVAVFESGGGGSGPAPVTLLDARAIPTGSSATQVTLAGGSLTDAQVLSFKVVGSSGSPQLRHRTSRRHTGPYRTGRDPDYSHHQLTGTTDTWP